MLTIWGRATSSNVQAVMWTVGELGLEHERLDRGHVFGGLDTPEFLAMNPNGLVPVAQDGDDEPLFESAAIVRYLAARYGGEEFWPREPAPRAQVDKWAEWAKTTVGAAFTLPVFWLAVRTPPAERDPATLERNVRALDARLDIAEAQLAQNAFLAGENFTLADVMFGHMLYRYYDMDIPRAAHPALKRYYAGLSERPAFREHVMVSYDSLSAK